MDFVPRLILATAKDSKRAEAAMSAGARRSAAMPSPRTNPVHWRLASTYLPGWDYLDTYEVMIAGSDRPDRAMTAAQCLLHPSPGAVRVLAARDVLARVASLKPAVTGSALLFPVIHASHDLVVLGFDDRHLDFRVLVDVRRGQVRCTTVVRRHNVLGHAYFAIVGPFHRLIMPGLLARATRGGWRPPRARPVAGVT